MAFKVFFLFFKKEFLILFPNYLPLNKQEWSLCQYTLHDCHCSIGEVEMWKVNNDNDDTQILTELWMRIKYFNRKDISSLKILQIILGHGTSHVAKAHFHIQWYGIDKQEFLFSQRPWHCPNDHWSKHQNTSPLKQSIMSISSFSILKR